MKETITATQPEIRPAKNESPTICKEAMRRQKPQANARAPMMVKITSLQVDGAGGRLLGGGPTHTDQEEILQNT